MTTDKHGRAYAKLTELTTGSKVQVDGGFTCLAPWSFHTVEGSSPRLFIRCKALAHYLDGQEDQHGYLIGIYPVGKNPQ